jgi:tRNA(adenine34) deaminase
MIQTTAQQDELLMAEALAEAEAAGRDGEIPAGAIAWLDGQIVGRGRNQGIALNDPTAHAEIQALRAAARRLGNYRLPGLRLYATLEPCAMCAGALLQARAARLVYGARDPKAGAVESRYSLLGDPRSNHRVEVVSGVLAERSQNLLRRFFEERR